MGVHLQASDVDHYIIDREIVLLEISRIRAWAGPEEKPRTRTLPRVLSPKFRKPARATVMQAIIDMKVE